MLDIVFMVIVGTGLLTRVLLLFKSRISYCRSKDLAVVVWLFADDSGSWNAEAAKNFTQYLDDLKSQGLFDQASTVVSGLELNEYFFGPRD